MVDEDTGFIFLYRCVACGTLRGAGPGETTPECCGAAMQPAVGLDIGAE
jgi:hypothetical protein